MDKNILHISEGVLEALEEYSWPGNLRELRNVIRRASLFVSDDVMDVNALPLLKNPDVKMEDTSSSITLPISEEEEKEKILLALEKTSGNKSKAARLLNVDRKTLYNKLKRYNLRK